MHCEGLGLYNNSVTNKRNLYSIKTCLMNTCTLLCCIEFFVMLFLSLCSEHNGSFVCEWILVTTFFYVNKKILNKQLAKGGGQCPLGKEH